MNENGILCPYCVNGVEMVMSMSGMYMRCPKCGSTSPTVFGIESAFTAREAVVMGMAARRYVPPASPNRPLTPEEFKRFPLAAWYEHRALLEPELRVFDARFIASIYSSRGSRGYIDNIEEYGKKWRAWVCKPTDAERAAAPWEV